MNRGDKVSVYSDIKGFCRRGLTAKFEGERMFLGNGQAVMSRHDIFVATSTPRYVAFLQRNYFNVMLSNGLCLTFFFLSEFIWIGTENIFHLQCMMESVIQRIKL